MSSEAMVVVENLSKCYNIYASPQDRLKQLFCNMAGQLLVNQARPNHYYKEFWAAKNISFIVNQGETVGIIGRNGSGKSTLLQMICGTLTPTSGEVHTLGRLAALLELGSGFNPEFTGRENVYLNAALLGLSKPEIDQKFEDIVDFSEIRNFIDEPVKTYSSGMMLRLAFAVQSQINPNILVVDEALAVGDAKFQSKCYERLKNLKEQGTSILLVTHSSEQIVTHCDRALLLENGEMVSLGKPRSVINKYLDILFSKNPQLEQNKNGDSSVKQIETSENMEAEDTGVEKFKSRPNYNPNEYRWGDRAAQITDFHLVSEEEPYPLTLVSHAPVSLTLDVLPHRDIHNAIVGFTIKNKEGVTLFGTNTEARLNGYGKIDLEKGQPIRVKLEFENKLGPGDYFVSVGVASTIDGEISPHDRRYDSIHFQVPPESRFYGLIDLDASIATHVL